MISSPDIQQILHELRLHQIELEMQNEELRRTQEELKASRDLYFNFYNLSPVGYIALSEKWMILDVNLTAADLLGVPRGALVRQPLTRFIFPEDQDINYLHLKQLFKTGAPQAYEIRMLKKNGSPFWVRLETLLTRDADGTFLCRMVMSNINERKRSEEALQKSLSEKEALLMEVHHRVKNNLAAIIALLEMQRRTQDDTTSKALLTLGGRIRSMALVHDILYQSGNLTRINFQEYFEKLIREMRILFRMHSHIRCRVTADIELSLDMAIPCGMIVNELISNCFKYAFPDALPRPGAACCEINISMEWDGNTHILIVGDNGVGLPADLDWKKTKTLGLRLVRMLGQRQLHGEISVDGTNGTCFMLRFTP